MASRVSKFTSKSNMANWRQMMRASLIRSGALLGAAALGLFALFYGLAVLSYSAADAAFNSAAADVQHNWMGQGGAYVSDAMLFVFGVPAIFLFPLLLVFARRLWRDVPQPQWRRQLVLCLIGMLLIGFGMAYWQHNSDIGLPAGWGGTIALLLDNGTSALVGQIKGVFGTLLRVLIILGALVGGATLVIRSLQLERPLLRIPTLAMPKFGSVMGDAHALMGDDLAPPQIVEPKPPRKSVEPDQRKPPVIEDRTQAPKKAAFATGARQGDFFGSFVLPSLELLDPPPAISVPKLDKAALEANARLLESVLDDFHVKGQIVAVRPGPVVTMYELEPAAGIKSSRVIQLAEDIARNMSALSARVSTIPGRTVMGIELPNAHREAVVFQEMVGSDAFAEQKGALPIILGKNISGDPVIADLAPMPHLLVAGTTGSGKSVGLNCMILSLLYRLTPDQCRMIMIDPKMLELSSYDDIPHLLSPVVTEPAKAIRALKWAVEQMEERYRMMSSLGVRNLANFNEKVRNAAAKGAPLGRKVQIGYDPMTGQPQYEEESLAYEPMPQIVVIVDELADLMMTAGKEVEFLIQRLAQKARAAGIHLIMATQRPSVDVITGVIKANLPTRISFHVTSKIDSRTILGEQGAEQLLGKGDMLYMASGRGLTRIHGPFVSDDEVRRVADHWRGQGQPDYIQAVTEEPEEGGFDFGGMGGDDSEEDSQYRKACQIVFESQKASTSWIQRQLRIGYNSAARLIDRMEEDGFISAPNHIGRREVLRDRNGDPI
ncbi:MAG: DNA translocase FtsK 4TM domain-containing protein [Sphingorhabdus sp.]|jgi:S-DNA-T family DNA segregation ATPase FtsK/SpoIIIE|uniref:DNA translocase FtsK 4TM domain-containing protein n=1 Tax=Sphingorhabdus sp. TaxID=1902408 RepID=UPI00273E024E|nr:DNA translocase FtsK 4TM domain-containing protein [Sphingorhabdus sp.]MCF8492822.1 DNA translocase FtsK 4TM domain-containing protein [Sphingomonadaceae bacterium]MCX7268731.1 DNA translocase FtsK 4TM domain-containing protein [Sphingomonadales bacterium]MCF8498276.1 DNA translocase FtsK 4TM domain-containing protein [Sphingomonadaceae bacterium]MDP4873224.1 DNA translocase FtsK 4TM domain-containing protein [Sphingorhabdus sp.]MDP4927327.1 DNA translocase FtsK 4TM domain-containing protei